MREDLAECFLNVVLTMIPNSLMFTEDTSNKDRLGKFHHTQPIYLNLDLIKIFSKIKIFKVSVLTFIFQQKCDFI